VIAAMLLAACLARADVRDLPLREFPAANPRGRIAILLTGDGGWRRIDAQIANRLREAGVPVAGFLVPDYFREQKTADESACALERTIRYYRARWNSDRVIVIGYSRGADVLPFMVSRLPADVRSSIDVVALLGLEPTIDFHYHASWIPFFHPREPQFPVLPEVRKLRGLRVLCVYGENEKGSACPSLSAPDVTVVREKGGHHFAGNYRGIADTILGIR
jgi:type IV secretory pathway VirJ component